jgi:hypothetical protein
LGAPACAAARSSGTIVPLAAASFISVSKSFRPGKVVCSRKSGAPLRRDYLTL